jgi:hypothetical protein
LKGSKNSDMAISLVEDTHVYASSVPNLLKLHQ